MLTAKRSPHILLITVFLLVFLSACSLLPGNKAPQLGPAGDTVVLEGDVTVNCSNTCRQSGQCGRARPAEGEPFQVVLISSSNPKTINHDGFLKSGAAVRITDSKVVDVTLDSTKAPFKLNYYQVMNPAPPNRSGWVAGFCVNGNP